MLELGVGTGRLALPLAERGLSVTGLDASPDMLDRLAAKDPDGRVRAVPGDVARPDGNGAVGCPPWPDGPFDVVLAAGNLLCNVVDPDAQAAAVAGAAARLRPGGHLVVEAFVPAESPDRRDAVTVRSMTADRVVLSVSRADPEAQRLHGQFVELVHGEPVRLRPWSLRYATPSELDDLAADAGLALAERWGGWRGEPCTDDSDLHVSVYRPAR